jgi:hypothetical protein
LGYVTTFPAARNASTCERESGVRIIWRRSSPIVSTQAPQVGFLRIILASASVSQAQQASGATEKAVLALENQWLQGQKTNNPDLIEASLDPIAKARQREGRGRGATRRNRRPRRVGIDRSTGAARPDRDIRAHGIKARQRPFISYGRNFRYRLGPRGLL